MCFPVLRAQKNPANSNKTVLQNTADERIQDYLQLVNMGYSEREIFEDLGNANFLAKNYDSASFWYQKLIDLVGEDAISDSYQERYTFARHKAGIAPSTMAVSDKDWYSRIKEDYQIDKSPAADELTLTLAENYRVPEFAGNRNGLSTNDMKYLEQLVTAGLDREMVEEYSVKQSYHPPIAVTADGRTAYFSKAVSVKPLYGLFSKKQLLHKIYKAEKIAGEWRNIQEVNVCPKYASAMHPAVSKDGKRLFFASDMPGSYGKYDIYVADISSDGSMGYAKNLGEKVNTKKNDMYPNLVGEGLLFFASDGRDGYGGLDLYAAQVGSNSVGLAMNIGSPFNSKNDDFGLEVEPDQGIAYVMSNRGTNAASVQELVFTYKDDGKNSLAQNRKYNFAKLLPLDPNSGYSNTVYED